MLLNSAFLVISRPSRCHPVGFMLQASSLVIPFSSPPLIVVLHPSPLFVFLSEPTYQHY